MNSSGGIMDNPKKIRDVVSAKKVVRGGIIEGVISSILAALIPILYFIVVPMLFYAAYKISRALEKSAALTVLCIISMLLPVVSVVILLLLNNQANAYLIDQRVEVRRHRDKWMACRVNVHRYINRET
jgi:hypothetical protein